MKKESTWVGEVGEKIKVPFAILTDYNCGEGQYGEWHLWSFIDSDGNILKKFGKVPNNLRIIENPNGESLNLFNKGDIFAFFGKVKRHDEYNGVKTTLLSRISKIK